MLKDGRTDSPCILQDFVPSGSLRGRCPKREIYVELEFPSYPRSTRCNVSIVFRNGCIGQIGHLIFPESFPLLHCFRCVLVRKCNNLFFLLFGVRPRREPEGTKSCRIQGESVRLYIYTSVITSAHPPKAAPGLSDVRT